MDERKQYWEHKDEWQANTGALFELRTTLAWHLLVHFGTVAGVFMDREDSAKRAVMELQTPSALVARCFAIADAFVSEAESRGEVRQLPAKPAKQIVGTDAKIYSEPQEPK